MPKDSSQASIVITPDIVLRAYAAGLFPMAESAEDPDLFWLEPEERGIFPLDGLIVSKSLAKTLRGDRYVVHIDRDFDGVIEGCATPTPDRPDTWINSRIRALYGALFESGQVHTVEAYREGALVGGLYGVELGGAFFGESMFHRATDASKVCLLHLAARLRRGGFLLLDTQFVTPHLSTLGAIAIRRARYRKLLAAAIAKRPAADVWSKTPMPGRAVLDLITSG